MKFQTPLVPATLIRRYKRFLSDIQLEDGREVVAHCPNPGSMMGMKDEGMRIWVEPNDDPKKKLKYGWRLAELGSGAMVGIDTSIPNRVVSEALSGGLVSNLAAYSGIRPEVKYGENSRVDFLLTQDGLPDTYVEVKSVTLCREAGLAEFPDSVTARGTKHLHDLIDVVARGQRAVMLYLVQRTDCDRFALAGDIDPKYANTFDLARAAGVEILCYDTHINASGVTIAGPLPVDPKPQSA
jgi:sugar fermentation stimulation protein A